MARVGVIILAAGESKRLGKPKQLLPFRGKALLRHAIDTALESSCRPVVVVLGASFDEIAKGITGAPVEVIVNSDWREGMASSIRVGLATIEADVDAVVLMVCDQPLVTPALLNELAASADNGLVASEFNGTVGSPAVFGKKYFAALKDLQGHAGAKSILLANLSDVRRIPFPDAAIDIDTASDHERFSE